MSDLLLTTLLLLLLSLPSILALPSDLDALLRLEFLVSSWTPNHHCSWRGVSCDSRSRVTSIRLPSSSVRFRGTLSPSIGQLDALRVLALPFLGLHGMLPPEVAEMESLEVLDLRGNSLQGPLPARFGRRLRILMLGFNRFSGAIPLGLRVCSELELLDLSHNRLGGGIPRWLGGMYKLRELYLSFNRFVGPIPPEVGERCGSLERVELAGYGLIGGIPGNIGQLRKLRSLESFTPSGNIRGRSLESTEGLPPPGKSSGFSSIEIASISSAAAVVSVLFALVVVYIYTRKCTPKAKVEPEGKKEITIFVNTNTPLTYEIVVRATGNFNASNCIGSGGFGATYKAEIAPGVVVAIKRLFVGKTQGMQQFHAEIKTLGRWRHPNLVTLIGFHTSEAETFLIYNYLPGGNLEKFISTRNRRAVDWRVLHKIALDIACALAYLHDQCVPRILHRDVKPSNILLDNDFNAYLSDFGLARLLGNSETHATTDVAGAFGYVDPNYATTCRVSDKADVYSYGVVLLELLSDKKALDSSFSQYGNGFNIVNWATMMFKKGKAREFFMDGLWGAAPDDDVIDTLRLALECTVDTPSNRPSMAQVVRRLKNIHPQHIDPPCTYATNAVA